LDKYLIDHDSLCIRGKSLVNFGPLITEISMWNHTHPNPLFWKLYFGP